MSDFIYSPITSLEELANYVDEEGVFSVRFLADFSMLLSNSFEENLDYFSELAVNIVDHYLQDFSYSLVGVNDDGSPIIEIVGSVEKPY